MSAANIDRASSEKKEGGSDSSPSPQFGAASRGRSQASFAQSFAHIVAVLMRDRNFRNLTIGDLEWLVLPPVMSGQFALAHAPVQRPPAKVDGKAQAGSTLVPVAAALWARVSNQLDKTLSENVEKQPKLRASDWVSGDNLWLIAVAGDRRALPNFLGQLAERDFKGKTVKMRVKGQNGSIAVKTLGRSSQAVRG